jgi:hypothetical protein
LKRATETIKTRKYRFTKKNPKTQKAIFKLDRGNVEQIISLSFPSNTQLKSVEIPKEKNPNLITLHLGDLKIAVYVSTPIKRDVKGRFIKKLVFDKGFIYDSDGNYSGKCYLHDLRNLHLEIEALFRLYPDLGVA